MTEAEYENRLREQIADPAKWILETQIRTFYHHTASWDINKFIKEPEFRTLYGKILNNHPMYKLFSTQPMTAPCALILLPGGATDSVAARTYGRVSIALQSLADLQSLHPDSRSDHDLFAMCLEEAWMDVLRYILAQLCGTDNVVKYRKDSTIGRKVTKTLSDIHTNIISGAELIDKVGSEWQSSDYNCLIGGIQVIEENVELKRTQFYDPLFPQRKVLSWKPQDTIFAPYCISGAMSDDRINLHSRYAIKVYNQERTVLITNREISTRRNESVSEVGPSSLT